MNTLPLARATQMLVAEKITPELGWQYAFSAFENGRKLLDGARTLQDRGLYGPARSLAISSREEFGKFIAALLYCIETYDATKFAAHIRRHQTKQTLGAVLAAIGDILKGDTTQFASAFTTNTATLGEAVTAISSQITTLVAKLPEPDKDTLAALEDRLSRAHSGEDELSRTEGLYVDLVDEGGQLRIRTPSAITPEQAEAETAGTRVFFDLIDQAGSLLVVEQLDRPDAPKPSAEEVFDHLKRMASALSSQMR